MGGVLINELLVVRLIASQELELFSFLVINNAIKNAQTGA